MGAMTIEHIARIEGHGNIKVALSDSGVRSVEMQIVEPARFFESMLVGRRFDEAPLVTSRICGICSPNHATTSIKALESALGIEVSERTIIMRKLLLYASFLQNHATHLYLFAAPDYVGQPSVFPLAGTHRDVILRALKIKKLGNDLTTLVGGRSVHPVTAVVGGFTCEPDPRALETFRAKLADVAEDAASTADLFASFEVPSLESAGDMLALVADDDYAIYEGDIGSLDKGWRRPVADYPDIIKESVVGHSNAKHSAVDSKPFMVGALARVDLSADQLDPMAKRVLKKTGLTTPSRNPFANNICQAVELVDAAKRCARYIERLLDMGGSSQPVEFKPGAGTGTAATEAPRGSLYHRCELAKDGSILRYDVITPTAQNLANLEVDMYDLAPQLADRTDADARLLVEELVRAYDPCLSCSVH